MNYCMSSSSSRYFVSMRALTNGLKFNIAGKGEVQEEAE